MAQTPSPKALILLILNKPEGLLPPVLPLPSLHHQPNPPQSDRLPGPHTIQPMHPAYHYVVPHQVPRAALVPDLPFPHEHAVYHMDQRPMPQGYMVPAPVVPMLAPVPYQVYPVMSPPNSQIPQHPQHSQHPQHPQHQHPQHHNQLPNPPPQQKHRRFRRRYYQIVRKYNCTYPGCTKRYGLLNHLNTHIVTKKHGLRKSKADFKDIDSEDRDTLASSYMPALSRPLLPTPPVSSAVPENSELSEKPTTPERPEGDDNEAKTLPRISDILDGPVKLPLLPSVVGYQN